MQTNRSTKSILSFLFLAIGLLETTARAQGQLIINEFLFRDQDSRLEFVELFNRSDSAVDLRDFELSDNRRKPVPIVETPWVIQSREYVVLVRDGASFDLRFSELRIEVPSWPVLNNGGDSILLWNNGQPTDSVLFDSDWGEIGASVERVDPNGVTALRENWQMSVDPTGATPGAINSVFRPDTTPPHIDAAEELLDGSVLVYLSEPVAPDMLQSVRFTFTSGERPTSTAWSHLNARVTLQVPIGTDLQSLTITGLVDGSGNMAPDMTFNVLRQPSPRSLVLSEILFEPTGDIFDGQPDQHEFIEIQSTTDHPITLSRGYITGAADENGKSDTLRFGEGPIRLGPHGFGVVLGKGSNIDSFRAAFPSLPSDSLVALIGVDQTNLQLANSGDTIRLHTQSNAIQDEVVYDRSWHLPELRETRGISLERISVSAGSNLATNWTSSVDPEGATPGRMNSTTVHSGTRRSSIIAISPSPFSPDADGWEDYTQIRIETGRAISSMAVWIFDSAGRIVRNLWNERLVGDRSDVIWDGRDNSDRLVPTGVYIVYVEAVDTSLGDVIREKMPVIVARQL